MFIAIAGYALPDLEDKNVSQTQSPRIVGDTNVLGEFIGQRVGRDIVTLNLQWHEMNIETWTNITQLFEQKATNIVEYFDYKCGEMVARSMRVDAISARPGRINPQTGEWITAKDCKLNLIDTGG